MSYFPLSSNLPQLYSDCANFPVDFSEFPAPVPPGAMWGDECGYSLLDYQIPPEVDDGLAVPGLVLPERGEGSDMAVPALPEFNMGPGGLCAIAGVQSFGGGYQQDMCEFGDECGGFMPDFRQVFPAAAGDNWVSLWLPLNALHVYILLF